MDSRYPTGRFAFNPSPTPDSRAAAIDTIGRLPEELTATLAEIPEARLDTSYREGGWTARQVVHHVADSHLNAYIRCKLALTELNPPLKPYDEALWAETVDGKTGDPTASVRILEGLHTRWHRLLATLTVEDFARTAHHPERGEVTLDWLLQLYAWHGRHHLGHLRLVANG